MDQKYYDMIQIFTDGSKDAEQEYTEKKSLYNKLRIKSFN